MSNDSSDKFLEWVLEKEQALISEYEQQGFISVFVTTFIDAGMSRCKTEMEGVQAANTHNEEQVYKFDSFFSMVRPDEVKEAHDKLRIVKAKNNKKMIDLDNGLLVLERMKEFVNSNIKKCEGQWGGCDKVGLEPHTCPFEKELHDDMTLCNCCENCQDSCHNNI